ncbi:kinesin-like protein KIF20A [Rhinoraja longicauda]
MDGRVRKWSSPEWRASDMVSTVIPKRALHFNETEENAAIGIAKVTFISYRYIAANMTSTSEFSTFHEAQTPEQRLLGRLDEATTQRCLEGDSRVKPSAAEDQRLKVYLRVRPFLKVELANTESQNCVAIKDSETVVLAAPKHSNTLKNSGRGIGQAVHKFTFSQIFGQETSQTEIFNGTVKDLVKQYLQGQNSLVFTYGVTNAGKTYTIQGTGKDGGILPRSLDMLFDHIKGRQYQGMDLKPHVGDDVLKLDNNQTRQEEAIKSAIFSSQREEMECRPLRMICNKSSQKDLAQASSTLADHMTFDEIAKNQEVITAASDASLCDQNPRRYSVWVSFCEIYNEYVYDLLNPIPTLRSQKRQNLRVCEDQKGNSYVKDLKWINITSSDEAFKVLKIGNKNRSLASTKMNHQSSRSHSIFSIRLLEIIGDGPCFIRTSDLNLCDLAGSERSSKAQTFGDRLKEAGNINTSLLILGKCISALRQKQQNKLKSIIVPFRESKLTRLFQSFFCGKGKACMIINISQCASMYDETLHVMKFSAIAKQIIQIIHPKIKLQLSERMGGGDGSMMVCTDLGESLSAESCYSEDLIKGDEEEQENEELDLTTFAHEELLNMTETLRHKLIAERQQKLVLEMRVREEMGEAMFQQLLRSEEIWSERFEDLKDVYEEKLDSKLHMYKESIRRHAYKCALEEVNDKYISKEEFAAEQHKAEVMIKAADVKVKELEVALCEYQNQPSIAENTASLLEELAWFKTEVSKMYSQLQNLQLEALVNSRELRKYQELYKSKVLSEEQSAKLLEEKDQVNKTLIRQLKDICAVLHETEKRFQENSEELQTCNDRIAKQEKVLKDVNKEHDDKISHLQNMVSNLQHELALSTKLSNAEKPLQMKKKLFSNLTGSKLAIGSPSKPSLFKSRDLAPRLKAKMNAVSGKLPSLPSHANK